MADPCWNCNQPLPDGAADCPRCGLQLREVVATDPVTPWAQPHVQSTTTPSVADAWSAPPADDGKQPDTAPAGDHSAAPLPNRKPWEVAPSAAPALPGPASRLPSRFVDVDPTGQVAADPTSWLHPQTLGVSTGGVPHAQSARSAQGPPAGPAPPVGPAHYVASPPAGAAPPVLPQAHIAPPPNYPPPTGKPLGAGVGSGSTGQVGTVQGQILEEQQDSRFWGWKLLLALVILSVVLTLLTSFDVIASQLAQLVSGLAVIVILICIIGVALGARGRAITSGLGRAGGAAARGAFGVVRMSGKAARSSVGVLGRASTPYALTLRRFRIVDLQGRTTSCVMFGEVHNDLMRQGDLIRVHGPRGRDGNIKVKWAEILDKVDFPPRSIVRPHKPVHFVVARTADLVCKVVAAGLVAYWVANLILLYRSR
jgi:hypothetical protein